MSAVLLNRTRQIRPKSEREKSQVTLGRALSSGIRIIFYSKKIIKRSIFFIIDVLASLLNKPGSVNKAEINKILVVGGGAIGDLIRVLPAIECLHDNFPAASISLLTSPVASDILALFPKSDEISEVVFYEPEGTHKSFLETLSLIRSLRIKNFDLIYSPSRGEGMRGAVLMNFMIGVTHRIGFKQGKTGLLNTIKEEFRDDIPILKQNLAILKRSNMEVKKEDVDLVVPEDDIVSAKKLLAGYSYNLNNSHTLITIHPGATWHLEFRCWPLEKYISLIRRLIKELGAKVIIIGSKTEIGAGKRINRELRGSNIINLIGKTSISGMAAVIKLSHFFIGNDSGPLHIALALKTPSIAIFGPTSPKQVIFPMKNCVVITKRYDCSPCYLHHPDFVPSCGSLKCLKDISVKELMTAVRAYAKTT